MEEINELTYVKVNFYEENGERYKIKATVSLDDSCHNGMCDWSVVADIHRKDRDGRYIEDSGGCCHEEIIKYCPELAGFVPLHLADHYGVPMYAVGNGMYHIEKSGKEIAMDYLRITEEEYKILSAAISDSLYFKYLLFDLGIVDRWRMESDTLLVELERLCGKKWVNPYKPEEERFALTLTEEEKNLIENRLSDDYYSMSNITKRREADRQAAIAKTRSRICDHFDARILELKREREIKLYVLDHGLSVDNMIYYAHSNTVVFNWLDHYDKITQEDFVDFVNNIDYSLLPEGVKFEIK